MFNTIGVKICYKGVILDIADSIIRTFDNRVRASFIYTFEVYPEYIKPIWKIPYPFARRGIHLVPLRYLRLEKGWSVLR